MVVLPRENAMEASYVKDAKIIPASTLNEVIECIKGNFTEVPFEHAKPLQSTEYGMDFADIHGQLSLKRAIMVAAARSRQDNGSRAYSGDSAADDI